MRAQKAGAIMLALAAASMSLLVASITVQTTIVVGSTGLIGAGAVLACTDFGSIHRLSVLSG